MFSPIFCPQVQPEMGSDAGNPVDLEEEEEDEEVLWRR